MIKTEKLKHLSVHIITALIVLVSALIALLVLYSIIGIFIPRTLRLEVCTVDRERMYDGTPLTGEDYTITYGRLAAGHSISILSSAEITKVGEVENTLEFIVVDELGEDVSNRYNIHTTYGTLRVVPCKIMLSTASGSKVYDGTPLTINEVIDTSGSLAKGEKIVVTKPFSATECGEYESRIEYYIADESGVDVTDMYEIISTYGTVKINKNVLSISTGSASRPYDGKPLVNETWDFAGDLMNGDKLELRFVNTVTNVGTIKNVPEVTVVNSRGSDVTSHYEVTIQPGVLEITPLQITVQTGSATKIYDGKPLNQTTWNLVSGDLMSSHHMEAIGYPELTDVGTIPNEVYFSIKDGKGADVTSNYKIKYIEGTLTVQPRPITIQTGSASKSYDGAPLSNDAFTVISGNLCSGHKATMVGSMLSGIGYTKNIPQSFKVMETTSGTGGSLTKDVTSNYSVTYQYGTLTMTK